jgi:ATP-dependent helicase/nuclease subunit B
MNNSFLYGLAEQIKSAHGNNLNDVVIVLPSQRASLFLKKDFSKLYSNPIWAPEILTIQRFSERLSGLTPLDNISLLFKLYDTYKKVFTEEVETLESFMKWGSMMLNDFNEVDAYMVDAPSMYSNLSDIKEIEEWSFNSKELTKLQSKYLHFWKKLGDLYTLFSQQLLSEKFGYSGLISKTAATKVHDYIAANSENKIYFAGLNALSKSEQLIISSIVNGKIGEVFWDADKYYLNNPKHEAGMFIRNMMNNISSRDELIIDKLSNEEKQLEIHALPIQTAQVKYVGELLSQIYQLDPDFENTAVVLSDESLLLPLLYTLPEEVKEANITMGFPFSRTPLFALVELYLHMINKSKESGNKLQLYFRDVLRFLNHPYVKRLSQEDSGNSIRNFLIKSNAVYVSMDSIIKHVESPLADRLTAIKFLFEKQIKEDSKYLLNSLNSFLGLLGEAYSDIDRHQLENEYFIHYKNILNRLEEAMGKREEAISFEVFKVLHRMLAYSESLSFFGEPLKGLQIMGILEARAIDFKHIIMVSLNEGSMPKRDKNHSFIPFDLRNHFELPGTKEKEAIYAYHFYRTMQRSATVHLLYVNSSAEGLKTSEKSRYLTQLQSGLHFQDIQENRVNIPVVISNVGEDICKNEYVNGRVKQLIERGISPSAINVYNRCSLDFYHTYILGIQEEEEVEENIENSTFGILVHRVLEKLFQPYLGLDFNSKEIDNLFKQVRLATIEAFDEKNYHAETLQYGKNLLTFNVVQDQVFTFLKQHQQELKQHEEKGEKVKILYLEKFLGREMSIIFQGEKLSVKIHGNIDRVDIRGEDIYLIDYKTGSVKPEDVKAINSVEDFFKGYSTSKALQMLAYTWVLKSHLENESITYDGIVAGLYSMRRIKAGLIPLKTKHDKLIKDDLLQLFEDFLNAFVEDLFDENKTFSHNPESKYCRVC